MYLNKHYIVTSFLIISYLQLNINQLSAQQEPQFSNFNENILSINPAYAGAQDNISLLLMTRWQWVSVEGAPRSNVIAIDAPIPNRRVGLGVTILSDNIGPITNTYLNLNYSYKITVYNNTQLRMGLSAGLNSFHIGYTDLNITEPDEILQQDYKDYFQPNLGTGVMLTNPKYFIGFSVPRLVQTKDKDEQVGTLKRHFYVSAGYNHTFNDDWKIKGSLLNKSVSGTPNSLEFALQTYYKNIIGIGASYRHKDAAIALIDMKISKQFSVGYAYDLPLSEIKNQTSGSHELFIRYNLKNIEKDNFKSPRYF